jgi:hypothetical protein
MADYSDLMKLEKKAKPAPPAVPAAIVPSPDNTTFASLLANQQTSKEEKKQTSLPENQHASKEVTQQISKETNQQKSTVSSQQTTKEKKKYGTYLREDSISAIQMLAIQTKQKDHVVLQEIVDLYFTHKK